MHASGICRNASASYRHHITIRKLSIPSPVMILAALGRLGWQLTESHFGILTMTKGSCQSCGTCEPTRRMMAHFFAGASSENAGLSEHRIWAQHLRPNALDDRLAAGVDAEVLERRLEVRRVRLQRAQPQHLRPHALHHLSVTHVGVRSEAVLKSGMCCFSERSISTCISMQNTYTPACVHHLCF